MIEELLQSVWHRPATVLYPAVKVRMPERFRGRLRFDAERCIGCRLCMRDCPTAAIDIRKVGDKKFEAEIDFGRCIYCAQCVDSCPKNAIEATGEFELAQLRRATLTVRFSAPPAVAPEATATAPAKPAQTGG
jgi:formate hydrogenlyase subunit 6/NADH:ubiquinone oxidoreductase subunit I